MDVLHAFLCLAWYQELLYPKAKKGVDASNAEETRQDATRKQSANGQNKQQQPTENDRKGTSALARRLKHSTFTSACRSARTLVPRNKDKSTPQQPRTPLTYHPLLHPVLPSAARHVFLSCYDTLLILVFALHIYTYIITIQPSMAECDRPSYKDYPTDKLTPTRNVPRATVIFQSSLSMRDRCLRLNWNIHIAGGFASALAALLAATHIVTLMCRLCEGCYLLLERIGCKMEWRINGTVHGVREPSWQHPPRDIGIHARNSHEETRATGRLTRISEEEINTGGEVTRRRQASNSNSSESETSKSRSSDSGRAEHALLEFLLP